MNNASPIPTKLYTIEAKESKERSEAELAVPDKSIEDFKKLLEKEKNENSKDKNAG